MSGGGAGGSSSADPPLEAIDPAAIMAAVNRVEAAQAEVVKVIHLWRRVQNKSFLILHFRCRYGTFLRRVTIN